MLPRGGVRQSTPSRSIVLSMKWLCASMNPGHTVRPLRSYTVVWSVARAWISSFVPKETTRPLCTAMAWAMGRCESKVRIVPFVKMPSTIQDAAPSGELVI